MGAATCGASVEAVWVGAGGCGDSPMLGAFSAFGFGHAKPPLPGVAGAVPEVLAAIRGAALAGWVWGGWVWAGWAGAAGGAGGATAAEGTGADAAGLDGGPAGGPDGGADGAPATAEADGGA